MWLPVLFVVYRVALYGVVVVCVLFFGVFVRVCVCLCERVCVCVVCLWFVV